MKKPKALVLFSGGLDSMLAVKVLQAQDIGVEALTFESNFFNADKAREGAELLGIKLNVMDISTEELELVKDPPSGYGKHLNPCIDCHAMMMRIAGRLIKSPPSGGSTRQGEGGMTPATGIQAPHPASIINSKEAALPPKEGRIESGFDIIASGEVLGQRPFSQNARALRRVCELAGVEILRPLSAKLLDETVYEKNGLVGRSKLLNIRGRTREKQMELARKFGISGYPSPAGGCLLTDGGFCARLKTMLAYWPDCAPNDVELLKYGRVFWLNKKIFIIVGRKAQDNESLERLAKKGDFMVKLKSMEGPTTLVRGNSVNLKEGDKELMIPEEKPEFKGDLEQYVCELTGYYQTKARGEKVGILTYLKPTLSF